MSSESCKKWRKKYPQKSKDCNKRYYERNRESLLKISKEKRLKRDKELKKIFWREAKKKTTYEKQRQKNNRGV